jgi:hypothetical protein
MEGEGLKEDLMDAGKKLVKKGSKLVKEKGEKLVKSAKKVGKKELAKLKDLELEDVKDMKKVGKYVKKVGKEVIEGMDGEGMEMECEMEGMGVKKPSKWIAFVKKYAKEHDIPYKQAMSEARSSYKK